MNKNLKYFLLDNAFLVGIANASDEPEMILDCFWNKKYY